MCPPPQLALHSKARNGAAWFCPYCLQFDFSYTRIRGKRNAHLTAKNAMTDALKKLVRFLLSPRPNRCIELQQSCGSRMTRYVAEGRLVGGFALQVEGTLIR